MIEEFDLEAAYDESGTVVRLWVDGATDQDEHTNIKDDGLANVPGGERRDPGAKGVFQ